VFSEFLLGPIVSRVPRVTAIDLNRLSDGFLPVARVRSEHHCLSAGDIDNFDPGECCCMVFRWGFFESLTFRKSILSRNRHVIDETCRVAARFLSC
jgi:hypothetical protein